MASTYLSRTASGGSRTTWTISTWVKRGSLGSGLSSNIFDGIAGNTQNESQLLFLGDSIEFYDYTSSTRTGTLVTTAKYRDVNAWYHIVAVWDTTNATAGDRMRLYVNGEEVTSFTTDTQPSLNQNSSLGNGTYTQQIGLYGSNSSYYFNGSMAHFHFIDGTAYDASAFGEYDAQNVWKPKTQPSVTYGTNGFFLKFANAGSLGTDSSSNGNDFTVNGTGTQTLDTPSNVFATMNVLNPQSSGFTVVNGNLSLTANATNAWRTTYGTLAVSSGKWYWEQKVTAASGSAHYIGITDQDENRSSATNDFENANVSAYCYRGDGGKVTSVSGSTVLTAGVGASFTTNDIIGIAMDLDNQKIYFSKNGTWQNSGDPTSGATGTGSFFDITAGKLYTPATAVYNTGSGYQYNFGNGYYGTTAVSTPNADGDGYGKFEYSVPTGYYALCTKNIQTYG